MKREQLEALSKEELIEATLIMHAVFTEQITGLTRRVAELEAQLNANSQNSSKPPSSDGLKKPPVKSLREKTGRKPGGQKGHRGHGLKIERKPDEVIKVEPIACPKCGVILAE